MKLREVTIKNFRNLVDVTVPINDTTVLIGENNSGKTAFLDALKIILDRGVLNKESPFNEYDYHMSKNSDSPQTSEGIVIELWFREDKTDEWPEALVQDLHDIIPMDPINDLDSIGLRLSSKYDEKEKKFIFKKEFLTLYSQPLAGKGAHSSNLGKFLGYICLFYLSALRDSNTEFSPRSRYWGRILRSLDINEAQRKTLEDELLKLNDDLLKADSKLEQVREALDKVQQIMPLGSMVQITEEILNKLSDNIDKSKLGSLKNKKFTRKGLGDELVNLNFTEEQSKEILNHVSLGNGHNTSIQALPLKPWDLMSRSEVVIKNSESDISFPLSRQGQGIQSLNVLLLFQAYIDILLRPTFNNDTEAILALEEPEAHLHPHAIRALSRNLSEIKTQKIISTHSPYFIQEIPFIHLRIFRRNGNSSKVLYIKRFFETELPNTPELLEFCEKRKSQFNYNETSSIIRVYGKMNEKEYRKLCSFYSKENEVISRLKQLYEESQLFLSDIDLSALETYAKRIRGEIFFARAWLLCEGQSEYLLLRYFAEVLRKPLDQLGISVIDFQNNGSSGIFVNLAKAFQIPWIMICDNDNAGKEFINQLKNYGVSDKEIDDFVKPLPEQGIDLERYLFKNGFSEEYKQFLEEEARNFKPFEHEWVIAEESRDKEIRQIIVNQDTTYKIKIYNKIQPEEFIYQSDTRFHSLFTDIIVYKLQQDKVKNTQALIMKMREMAIESEKIPDFFVTIITNIIERVQ